VSALLLNMAPCHGALAGKFDWEDEIEHPHIEKAWLSDFDSCPRLVIQMKRVGVQH
jgi:hypothetical protein